jgi:hypothetical protein
MQPNCFLTPPGLAPRARGSERLQSARGARYLCLLAAAVAVTACDRTEGNARSSECARFCESLEKCDDATDLLDCTKQCEADEVRSDRYYQARADCGEELSCSRWASEVNGRGEDVCNDDCALVDCVEDTLAEITLDDAEKDVCMALGTKLNACDEGLDASLVIAQCESVTPVLSEAYLAESKRCGEQLCAQIESCFDKLSDRHQTDLRLISVP